MFDKTEKQRIARQIAERPLFQAAVIFAFSALLALLDRAGNNLEMGATAQNAPWVLMTTSVLFYAVCCSVLSLWSRATGRYWREAIFTFVGLMVAAGSTATLLSGQSIDEAGSFRWLFIVLAIGFLVFVAIVRLMRRIVDIAIRQDDKLRGE